MEPERVRTRHISKSERRRERKRRRSAESKIDDDGPPVESWVEVKPAPGKGMGLFALQHIPKGKYLFDYEGEILSETELKFR
jgi:hypothetical protein